MNSKLKIILILIVVCNLAAFAGYYFLFQKIKTDTQTASALSDVIDVGQQKNSHLNSLRADVKDTESKRQQLVGLFLSSDEEISFIEQVENLAKSSGLKVKTSNVSSVVVDTSPTKVFQMETETAGNWSNQMYFIAQVQSLPYSIAVHQVSLINVAAGGVATSTPWAMTLDINVNESL